MASGTIKAVVGRSDIVDNLTTNDSTKVLSAAQGKALKDAADTLNENIENKVSFNEVLKTDTSSTSDDSVIALAAFNKAPPNGTAFVMQDTTGAVRHCLVFKRSSQGSVLMLDSYNKTFKCANIINNAVSSVNDISRIGDMEYGTNANTSVSIPDGTSSGTECSSMTLSAGKWHILACADWGSNGNGFRQISFAAGTNPGRAYAVTTQAIAGKEAYQQLSQFASINAETTYKMYAMQNSGSTLNVSPYFYAIRIA